MLKKLFSLLITVSILVSTVSYAVTEQVFTAYDSYPALGFENVLPDSATWGGEIKFEFSIK